VYSGAALPENTRSLAYKVRLGATDRTLSDKEISEARSALIAVAESHAATLR
jgi:phenylalanyl-tRNA synthetase beta subunit